MVMIKSVVRPEKVDLVMDALLEAGFPAVTKVSVVGRGQQKGIKVGEVVYDELPKEMLVNVVPKADKDMVLKIIMGAA
ncbi:MAG: P-II family nitrogen regulator, partial [Sphaerochaetaceae bacterium]|nr:P-II family nitrogen regulator [Sphaerochaetaceae bacterium]